MQSDVTVLGSGFSATSVIVNLLEHLPSGATIAAVGRAGDYGRGIAYSTKDPNHRLNVPAGRMSLFADRPNHLAEWLVREGYGFGKEDFVPRQIFGAYVQATLAQSLQHKDNRARVTFHDADAIDCERLDEETQIFNLSNGARAISRHSIFCLGGTPTGLPIPDGSIDQGCRPHVTINAWAEDWLAAIDPDATVMLLGSGLTAVDQIVSLHKQGHQGMIHVLSRHGLLPQVHQVPRSDPADPAFAPGSHRLSDMLHALRAQARDMPDWRMTVDALRPTTQALWQAMDSETRARFFRHGNAWWGVHRHRMAPEIAAIVHGMRESGQVVFHKGWLRAVRKLDGQAEAIYTPRHGGGSGQIVFDRIVNCTGLEKCTISKVPLLKKMSARGLVAADEQGLGLAVSPTSELVAQDGAPQKNVYAMGPMTVGQFFEIFAVPDIRVQARAIAQRIAERI